MSAKKWTDETLREAVAASTNWNEVARQLGLSTSARVRLRTRGEELGLSTTHFQSLRRWSEADLPTALRGASTWRTVLGRLGLSYTTDNRSRVRSTAVRLGLDCSSIDSVPDEVAPGRFGEPDRPGLRFAAPHLAAAWFETRGYRVSDAADDLPYDLIVHRTGARPLLVQVKSSTNQDTSGAWTARVSRMGWEHGRTALRYQPEDVDFFFVITGDGRAFLLPYSAVAGRGSLNVGGVKYAEYEVDLTYT